MPIAALWWQMEEDARLGAAIREKLKPGSIPFPSLDGQPP
jgi:hypothetical protein